MYDVKLDELPELALVPLPCKKICDRFDVELFNEIE